MTCTLHIRYTFYSFAMPFMLDMVYKSCEMRSIDLVFINTKMDVPGFVAVTGSSEDVARRFLEAFAGDLNQAVESYFENPQGFQERPSSSNASTSTDVSNEE